MLCFLKNVTCRPKLLHTQKSFAGQVKIGHHHKIGTIGHYNIHLLVLKLFILEAEECDVTQFNQLNLNSPFSHQAIN